MKLIKLIPFLAIIITSKNAHAQKDTANEIKVFDSGTGKVPKRVQQLVKVKDIPEAWNEAYKTYLGVDVPTYREGMLQDVHWSHGSFGYFPTYSLGSFYAVQFYHQAKKDVPDLEKNIIAGNTKPMLDWLREKIHPYGRFYNSQELCEHVTGEKLSYKYFKEYAEAKYSLIYGL